MSWVPLCSKILNIIINANKCAIDNISFDFINNILNHNLVMLNITPKSHTHHTTFCLPRKKNTQKSWSYTRPVSFVWYVELTWVSLSSLRRFESFSKSSGERAGRYFSRSAGDTEPRCLFCRSVNACVLLEIWTTTKTITLKRRTS